MAVSESDFLFISGLLYDRLGFRLEKEKAYLVESRLAKVVESAGVADLGRLILLLKTGRPPEAIVSETLEAMTTNETFFFRDIVPFDVLREKVLPDIIAKKRGEKTLAIWSAACSTGQEAYSIAMTLRESFPHLSNWNVRIIGTDVATKVMAKAQEGIFNQTEMNRGVSPQMLAKYFTRHGGDWKIKDEIRKMVSFRPLNLIQPWPLLPRMDVIFLRNVLIYMENDSRKSILDRAHRQLERGGYMFLGAAETTFNLSDHFTRMDWKSSGCFQSL
ncbi:MAG TPA: protein-glutamate O-methyltransferase CheR [Fibrobacteria bacterium]|nr:protein-glutamate O-methyltransferase CheR [Fibrobacteria bacterium]